jgi:plasmid stabilization system protein ParE
LKPSLKHIQEENPSAARETAQILLDSVANLKLFPRLGRPSEDVEGSRELGCPPYVIVYRLKDDVAEILYIWHGAQDWR